MLVEVMRTHPTVIFGEQVMKDNAYYIPPAEYLSPHSHEAELKRMLNGLVERHSVGEALRDAEERFRAAVDLFPSMYIIFDPDLKVTFINRRGLSDLEKSAEETAGVSVYELMPYEVAAKMDAAMKEALATHASTQMNWHLETKGGHRDLETYMIPVEDEDNDVVMLLSVSYDHTERESLMNQIATLEKELREAAKGA